MKRQIAIDVREFAVPIPRQGSIEPGSGYGLAIASALGQEIHKVLQRRNKEVNPQYRAEVKVSHKFEIGEYCVQISGRIDGMYDEDISELNSSETNQIRIEEIKTAFGTDNLIRSLRADEEHPYCLQVKTYAYLWWKHTGGNLPDCSILVASMFGKGDKTQSIEIPLQLDTFEQWFARRIADLVHEADRQESEYKRRKRTAKKLKFPFEHARSGQAQLMDQIEQVLANGKPILVQAPTGLGKTMAVLFPALRDALQRGQRLIYCTPKNSLHLVAEDAANKLRKEKARVKSLTLTAKSKLCMLPEPICDPTVCEYARDHYSKVAKHDLINEVTKHNEMTPRLFKDYAEQYKVCPFELSIDCIDRSDIVICDYNHVFAPISLSGRLTAPAFKKSEKANLVIDEAHNLHSRATGYFSASVSIADLRQHKLMLPSIRHEAAPLIDECITLLERIAARQALRESRVSLDAAEFVRLNDKATKILLDSLDSMSNIEQISPVLAFSRYWSEFSSAISQEECETFTTCRKVGDSVCVKVTCCDASSLLRQQYLLFQNVVAFSATLKPFDYYSQLSGFDADSIELFEASSPFPKSNRKVLVIPQVSTKYKDRETNYGKIADAISRIIKLKPANYVLFFPSFDFLDQIAQRITETEKIKLIQKRSMTRCEVSSVLDTMRFNRGCLLFAVQGGIFAEGIDFAGDMASAAIIVGPGLPSFDLERELLREYYEKTYGAGFEYAYTYPAMTKVIQSAGRVIRSEHDRGLIVLMDQRFVTPAYAQAMPVDWFSHSVNELVSTSILKDISAFWQSGS